MTCKHNFAGRCPLCAHEDAEHDKAMADQKWCDHPTGDCLHKDEFANQRAEIERLHGERDRLRGALQMTLMLKRLGGMLPGTHEMVQLAVSEAEEALKKVGSHAQQKQESTDRG